MDTHTYMYTYNILYMYVSINISENICIRMYIFKNIHTHI